jgi:hypothetical protein
MGFLRSTFDVVFILYFVSHIPITLLVDSQGVFPRDGYPQFARDMLDNFLRDFKDPLVRQNFLLFKLQNVSPRHHRHRR